MSTSLWPVTILMDRYQGTYSGGEWLAFNCTPDQVPEDAQGQDVPCAEFFGMPDSRRVGRGRSPSLAFEDLQERLHVWGRP